MADLSQMAQVEYIRNTDDLIDLPKETTEIKFNNYIGLRTTKKLNRFTKMKKIIITPNTQITNEARKYLKNRKIRIVNSTEKPGRKPLREAELPEIADLMVEVVDKIKGLALINRPLTTIIYAEYRLDKNVDIVTTESNIKEIARLLKAERPQFNMLKVKNLNIRVNIVPNSDYEEMFNKSLRISVKTPNNEAKVRILAKRAAIRIATNNPTAHALQDAFTIMMRNNIKHVIPTNEYLAFMNHLAKHPHIKEKELERLRNYYVHDAPIDMQMMREVVKI